MRAGDRHDPGASFSSGQREIEADTDADSALGDDDDANSETQSVSSSLLEGKISNGRKYAALRDDIWTPSDEQQFEAMDAGHLLYLLLESDKEVPFFRAPMTNPQRILDIGSGSGTWAIDVADRFPAAVVHGVDLAPPLTAWMPPNCILEIDDVNEPWSWRKQFDLIHLRQMLGNFDEQQWSTLYARCYDTIEPGGWIEQLEFDIRLQADDGTLPADSELAQLGPRGCDCAERAGRSLKIQETMRQRIEAAGFVNVQERLYKCPVGTWPKDKVLKEAGRLNALHWSGGIEGWSMFLLTNFGDPLWSAERVRVHAAQMRLEMQDPRLHVWHWARRVWAQKPYAWDDSVMGTS
jgi:SAM-dependent methyltransferase